MKRDATTWMRFMMVAFVCNGISPFGLKILSEMGLAGTYKSAYLFYWYAGAVAFALLAFLFARQGVNRTEVGVGAVMGLCSALGLNFSVLALSNGIPGYLVFPLTTGGSLFVVALSGLLLFREPVGKQGIVGIFLGITALVLLATV